MISFGHNMTETLFGVTNGTSRIDLTYNFSTTSYSWSVITIDADSSFVVSSARYEMVFICKCHSNFIFYSCLSIVTSKWSNPAARCNYTNCLGPNVVPYGAINEAENVWDAKKKSLENKREIDVWQKLTKTREDEYKYILLPSWIQDITSLSIPYITVDWVHFPTHHAFHVVHWEGCPTVLHQLQLFCWRWWRIEMGQKLP